MRLTFNAEKIILSLRERASIAFGCTPAKPATAFRISFAGNPHPLQRTKHSAVFPPVKRFVQHCRTGREVDQPRTRAAVERRLEPILLRRFDERAEILPVRFVGKIKRGARKRAPLAHKAPQCGAFLVSVKGAPKWTFSDFQVHLHD